MAIPKGLASIGWYAFEGCSNLTSVTVSDKIKENENYTFENPSNFTNITTPQKITHINKKAFKNSSSLINITILEKMPSVGDRAFENCTNLTDVTLPEGITSIGHYAFSGCSNLTSVILPKGVTEIGEHAFKDCSSLTNITIPKEVTEIGEFAFEDCSSLKNIIIPEGVTIIDEGIFLNCTNLTDVILPEGLTLISLHPFLGCNSLKSLIIPKSVDHIYLWLEKDNNLTLYCYANSYAETYAKKENIPYQLMDTLEEEVFSTFFIDSAVTGKPHNTITITGTFTLDSHIETSFSILSSEIAKIKWTTSDSSIAEVTNCIGVQSFHNRKATLLISVISYQEGTVEITGTALNSLTSSCIVTISNSKERIKYENNKHMLPLS